MNYSQIVKELATLDLRSYPCDQVLDLIRSVEKIGALVYKMKPGMMITRAREGVNYSKSDLSYKPQNLNTKYQRASTPNKTMFYGAIVHNDDELINTRAITLSECSKLAREGKESLGIERFTFGRWKVINDIELIAIIPLNAYLNVKNNPLLTEIKTIYSNFISNEIKVEENFQIFIDFISKEFCKEEIQHDSDYLLSAIFSEVISNDFEYDGILYPSVRMSGDYGMNVALKPEAVDRKLELEIIGETTFYKYKEKSLLSVDKTFAWDNVNNIKFSTSSKIVPKEFICEKLGIHSLDVLSYL